MAFIQKYPWLLITLLILAFVACQQSSPEATVQAPSPTATTTIGAPDAPDTELSSESIQSGNFITIVTDAPSRFGEFEDIDQFGSVIGFDPDVIATLATLAGFEYEFVVTGFDGLLDSVANGEFDTAMSALVIPDEVPEGLVFSDPYLEVGQVLVVRANETEIQSFRDIGFGIPLGVQRFTSGEQIARGLAGLQEADLQLYDTTADALQALIDREVEAVIIDSVDANYFTETYPQQLKIAGGAEEEAWISRKAYGIAVNAQNEVLLQSLNAAIERARGDGTIQRLTRDWLVPEVSINAGESLVGTPEDELVIGMNGQLGSLDPADRTTSLIDWEVRMNTSAGLLMVNTDNQLVPVLAAAPPEISEDKLSYTLTLKPGLTFPDGSELTAQDVKFSIDRAAGLGNFQVNRYLKDANGDNFADDDAVQVVDALTVRFTIQEPTSYFPSVLATPPFFVVSQACYSSTPEPATNCAGLGPYTVTEWESGVQMRLEANSQWPGTPPAFRKIQIRFYDDPARMRRSFENSAIDLAWTGMSEGDVLELRDNPSFRTWEGAPAFKSYLVFEQSESPWSNARIREAIAHAIDRDALANNVFARTRKPLFSPVPDQTPGQLETEPDRDLDITRAILRAAGYSTDQKLQMTIWYVNDGRYTNREEAYAAEIKRQLEETELIEVTLEGAPWEVFRPQSLECNYPVYMLGWPSSGQPAAYIDAMSWMEYFITNTEQVCSNYESAAMEALLQEALEETDDVARLGIYAQIQELWAREFPTLDLTQEPRVAVALPNVDGIVIDAMGLMHYDVLTKTGGQ